MTDIKFTKGSQLKAEIIAIRRLLNDVIKFSSFTTNHKNHGVTINSSSKEKGTNLEINGVLTSKDTVEISQIIEKRLEKRLRKLNKQFKRL